MNYWPNTTLSITRTDVIETYGFVKLALWLVELKENWSRTQKWKYFINNILLIICWNDKIWGGGRLLLFSHWVVSNSFATPWTIPHQALCPWDFPGQYIGVGCPSLLQGIFPTQGLNANLPHCRQIPYCLNVNVKLLSRVRLFATPWTVAYQAPLSMGFSRQ